MIKSLRNLLIGLLIAVLVVGCSQENPADGQNEQAASPTAVSETMIPTSTPAPPRIILLAGAESDPALISGVRTQIEQFAAQQGMVFEHRQILDESSAPENLQVVVALPPAQNLPALAAGLPNSIFVGLNIPGLSGSGNLIAVGGGQPSDFQAFLAGYIAAVQSDDWRVGIIYPGDEAGRNYKNAFLSGAIYFCGFCNPYYPPYYEYPLFFEVPIGASAEVLQQAADTLISQGVNTMHLAPGVEDSNIYSYLTGNNMRFVGPSAPPAGLEGNWIASVLVGGDVDLIGVLNGVVEGQTEFQPSSAVQISFTGLSSARLSHFMEILAALESGEIDPQGSVIE